MDTLIWLDGYPYGWHFGVPFAVLAGRADREPNGVCGNYTLGRARAGYFPKPHITAGERRRTRITSEWRRSRDGVAAPLSARLVAEHSLWGFWSDGALVCPGAFPGPPPRV
jgi:hypothetical protein